MRRFGTKHTSQSFKPPKLNITSMMDMFTIILIFLLFSFSSEPEMAGLDKDMQLPQSTSKTDFQDTIKLVLSQSTLKMGDEVVAQIENDAIVGLDPKNLKSSGLFIRLSHRSETLSKETVGPEGPHPILLLCDRRLPFKTINQITKTAALAGFPNFQFAVLEM